MVTTLPGGWLLTVGLEVHVELNTKTKMFSWAPADFAGEPNTRVAPVDAGLPGTLPVPNKEGIRSAALLGLAIGCDVAERSRFHRKNYFYPDLPKGYQISQYDVPICHDGELTVEVEGNMVTVGIERLHMEEDTGKSSHEGGAGRLQGASASLLDYNRAGIPLLEIVSRPDIHDPETAMAYLRELQAIILAVGVSDARMDEGSMRCDANVSVARPGDPLGTRCEVKNVNSIKSVGKAIEFEALRQIDLIEGGEKVIQQTRHWNEDDGITTTLRTKETVADYRYFPDPDLTDVVCPADWVADLKASLPELPAATRDRITERGVTIEKAYFMTTSEGMVAVFDAAVDEGADAVVVANWLTGEVTGQLASADLTIGGAGLTGAHMAELVAMIADGSVSNSMARDVLAGVIEARGEAMPRKVAADKGLEQMSDTSELEAIVQKIVDADPKTVASIKGGNDKAIGALVGGVMRETKGKANPGLVNELLRAAIDRS